VKFLKDRQGKSMRSVERIPVVQQVTESLKEHITSGAMQVGEKLPAEKDLCGQLGVGRGTVREAFRILQAHGFVEIKPGRGAFVARTTELKLENIIEWFVRNEVELKDCIEIRTALEPLAIRLTIQRCSDADIAQIARIHEKFMAAANSRDTADIAKYDERFHNQIVEKSQNQLLISINRKVSECVYAFRSKTFLVEDNIKNAIEPHHNILGAIQSRNVEAGERHIREHLDQILIDLEKITEKKG